MSILDLSKQHMKRFYYDVMKPKYGDNIRIVYTDTDSFVFHTRSDDIYQDLQEINDEMDFSGYDKNHNCYDATNKKVLGKFKDECEGKIMEGFTGLRPKCYAFKIHGDDKEYKKCKGTAKNTVIFFQFPGRRLDLVPKHVNSKPAVGKNWVCTRWMPANVGSPASSQHHGGYPCSPHTWC